ncbi:hypothetical protein [Plantibacter cousiniae (nom. nud.)]|uniref:Energy-coupling factor transport system substrate-specific component n=1 Tax=Plantibacter cousiniae (nom. nud.) TaxID=199709 RepID=A0ABY1LIY7_9MICO|nr:hypothetical protein [Plantibacter cousiniae]SKC35615.1 hypothetical protein SAMN06295973_0018 [Plantibacter cousiniae]
MPSIPFDGAKHDRYWMVPILRAVIALATAGVVTFTQGHSSQFGLVVFGVFTLLSGAIVGAFAFPNFSDTVTRAFFLGQGVIGVVTGIFSLLVSGGGLSIFLYVVTLWAALTGFLELYSGIRWRGRLAAAKDWTAVGAFTVLLAIATLLVPPGLEQRFAAPGGVEGVLRADIVVVGLVGAYAAIIGVYLVIGGLSLRWAGKRPVTGAATDDTTGTAGAAS